MPLDEKLAVILCEMSVSKTQISEIGSKLDTCLSLKDSINRIENKLETYDSRLLLLEYKSLYLEARSRRRNLLFTGFPENRNENCYEMIKTFINQNLEIHTDVVIDRAHRLGKYKQGLTRGIIVAFRDFADVGPILSNENKLKGTEISINRDYPREISNARRSLWSQYKELKRTSPSSTVNIVYPAKLVKDGRVIKDCFPHWGTIMSGNRVNTPDVNNPKRNHENQGKESFTRDSPGTMTSNSTTGSHSVNPHSHQSRSPRRRRRYRGRAHAPSRSIGGQPISSHEVPSISRPWTSGSQSDPTKSQRYPE